jgi:hypothetical protein
MRRLLFYLVLIGFAHAGLRQVPPSSSLTQGCPEIRVDCPVTLPVPGEPATFTANVNSSDPNASLTYQWSVSAGTITKGQGTLAITVDTVGLGGASITASLEVNGANADCPNIASCTMAPYCAVLSRKFDEYGDIAFQDEMAHLDNFATQLENEPGAQGYIASCDNRRGETERRADRARSYLISSKNIDPGRLVVIDGGFAKKPKVQLWVVPTGATPPKLVPDDSPDKAQTGEAATKHN